ncbi:MAG: NUDIX domain-containing protein [Anaerolineales bacterium]|nr:NUDIX domain-containing protein [Anaerolineales bacterium]
MDGERPILLVGLTIIERNGEFLLIQESKPACRNKWFLPGGRALPHESIAQAAERETQEESGIRVELTGLLYVDQRIGSPKDEGAGRIRFVFLGKPAGGALKQTEDGHSIRAAWFSEEEIGRLDLRSPFVRKALDIYHKDPAIIPMTKVHALTPADLALERP